MSQTEKTGLLRTLFTTFFKIGLFTFGGGLAMLPLIQKETVETHKWISEEDIYDIIAFSESTPGPLAVKSATFVGYRLAGMVGAITAALGVILPSFIVITIISYFLDVVMGNQWVNFAFAGIRSGVVVLMLSAVVKLMKPIEKTAFAIFCMAGAFAIASFTSVSVILVLVAGAALGVVTVMTKKEEPATETGVAEIHDSTEEGEE